MFSMLHRLTSEWFQQRFGAPTEPQRLGWPAIASGRHTLIAAPTGSGKTLAAFLISLDRLVRQGVAGDLPEEVQTLYVSPLKALSNDVQRNLEVPLAEITDWAWAQGTMLPPMRALVRTGDTPQHHRQAMARRPPQILVTTPESLYLLLTSASGRRMLRSVRTVIVDEIHALARDKRGSHLSLSLERLDALCERPPVRIGLSATQRPIEQIACYLVGGKNIDGEGRPDSHIIDTGHVRALDLAIEVPPSELLTVCSHETWAEVYGRLCGLIAEHRSTLVFVNTRRLAERVAHHLRESLGEGAVASHHGSLSREIRLSAEQRLKAGELKAVVATASLELGIDVGYVDLVCQIGSPRSIATFLQRVGRSGHSLGLKPKGRLFPLSRGELLECMALVRAVRAGRLDAVEIPTAPLDILAQQIVAETAAEACNEDDLFDTFRQAWPYRELARRDYEAILDMLSRGIAPGKSRRGAYVHRDRIHRRLRARRGARIAAVTSGGAIPEMADYRVVTLEDRTYVGSVNEDFAIESMAGDIFLLGNTSWRVQHVRNSEVVVQDAQGAPATIPFWVGEAPARTVELSQEYSDLCVKLAELAEGALRQAVQGSETRLDDRAAPCPPADSLPPVVHPAPPADTPSPLLWLQEHCGTCAWAAEQALNYVASQKAALGMLASQRRIVFERFFDESGGMQLVIHSPLGARVNRAWGLSLRKRFCRSFNFELQAIADDNGIVLSLGPQHSFPLEQMFTLVRREQARDILIQAVLAVPFFTLRWRWNCNRALAVLRHRGGKRVPPHLQRMQSDDLLSAVFPMSTACLENVVGDIALPDHPLVQQTMHDCLHEAMDVDRWLELIGEIEAGTIELVHRDTREPSPFSYELLHANPYAFLDPAPLEERRARAVATRRSVSPDLVRDLCRLDPEVIRAVVQEAWPLVRDADELHDALSTMVALPARETDPSWHQWFDRLRESGRATEVHTGAGPLWIASENWPLVRSALPEATADPIPTLPADLESAPDAADGWIALVRGRLQYSGPVTAAEIAAALALETNYVSAALEALEGEGFVLRGHWTSASSPPAVSSALKKGDRQLASTQVVGANTAGSEPVPNFQQPVGHSPAPPPQWCERRLLARIHRLTLQGLRRQIEPVSPADYFRFLCGHSHVLPEDRLAGREGLWEAIGQLSGFETPAGAWETDLLPLRVADYDPSMLDALSFSGRVGWGRLQPPKANRVGTNGDDDPAATRRTGTGALTRAIPLSLFARTELPWLLAPQRGGAGELAGSAATEVLGVLEQQGALFFDDVLAATGLLCAQVEGALSELSALGLISADGFAAIRRLIAPEPRRTPRRGGVSGARRRAHQTGEAGAPSGRWSTFPRVAAPPPAEHRCERWARLLLRRYGVVFRDVLARESVAPSWWELVRVFRRLEARGEIRGGRFVYGVGGEQYALDDAVARLRQVRDRAAQDEWVFLSAADPLNLAGIVLPGARVPALRTNALALCNGRLVAARVGGKTQFYEDLDAALADQLRHRLRRTGLARMRMGPLVAVELK